jgi:four helix bundle protein
LAGSKGSRSDHLSMHERISSQRNLWIGLRNTRREYINFLFMARGSAREMLSHCLIAKDLGYLEERSSEELIRRYDGLSAGIYTLIKKLKTPIERSI